MVFAFGDAASAYTNRLPGPVKPIRREIEKRRGIGTGLVQVGVSFREVKEDYTSKLCSKCNMVLEPMLDQKHKPIHAVRRYLTTSCVRLWHRDVNACPIIYAVFTYENSNQGQRPDKFLRVYSTNRRNRRHHEGPVVGRIGER